MIVPEKVLEMLMLKYSSYGGKKVLVTDDDYNTFSHKVAEVTNQGQPFHCNTWKHVFRHLKKKDGSLQKAGPKTLQVIAVFLGFEDWKELMENMDEEYEKIRRKGGRECISTIQPASQTDLMLQYLHKGDIIEILYYPERILYLEFIKKDTYRVVKSYKSGLKLGDIIYTSLLEIGIRLIVDVVRDNTAKKRYRSGVGHTVQSIRRLKQEEISKIVS